MYIIGWLSTAAVFTLQEQRLPRPPWSTVSTNTAFSSPFFKWEIKQGSTGLALTSVFWSTYSFACLSIEKSCCYLKLPRLSYGVAVFRFSVLTCARYAGMGLSACTLLKWLRNLHYECDANTLEIHPFDHTFEKFDIFVAFFFFFITNENADSHRWQTSLKTYLKAHPELKEYIVWVRERTSFCNTVMSCYICEFCNCSRIVKLIQEMREKKMF